MENTSGWGAAQTPRDKALASEREITEQAQRALLSEDLLRHRLAFRSRPYEAHIGFGTYCNQSCIMCWDGENPPAAVMPGALLTKIREQIAPTLSLIIPYCGSEPLAANWQAARGLAKDADLQIALTTNAELLDEKRFAELIGLTQTLVLSVDSHRPEVLERIRRTPYADRILANLERAARLSQEHGIECIAQIVFLTENVHELPETIEDFARRGIPTVSIIPMINVNGHSGHLDPRQCFPSEEIEGIRLRCIEAAHQNRIRLLWEVDGSRCHDHRDDPIHPALSKQEHAHWHFQLQRYLPGYCAFVTNSVRIDIGGDVAPCCFDVQGALSYGNLAESDFEALWNSATARDLRRAMQTEDLPTFCRDCRFIQKLPPQAWAPFIDQLTETRFPQARLESFVEGPEHHARVDRPPTVVWRQPSASIRELIVIFSLGGEGARFSSDHPSFHVEELRIPCPQPVEAGMRCRYPIPRSVWEALRPNCGYWWTVYAIDSDPAVPALRSREIYCLTRHEPRARIPGSRLIYPSPTQPTEET